ncbi:MAG: type I methionyl aminopeptidase [Candidatus Nanopelagicales bacterium]
MLGRRTRIEIKSGEELALMRAAGLVVAGALAAVREAVAPGVRTDELDAIAAEHITGAGATSNFKGYHGFPGVICTSVNDEVVHGIPGPRVLRSGDLLSVDCGAIVEGWHGDAAITVPVGEVRPELLALSAATQAALWAGIARALVGGRLSDIGAACEAELAGRYGIVRDYVGHGIGSAMHMEPSVAHVGPPGRGPVLRAGMALAIEPMVTLGSPETTVLADEWTVATVDGLVAAHWEHSVALTDSGPLVLTALDGGAAGLAALGVARGSVGGSEDRH